MFIFPVPSTQLTESLLNIYHEQRITFENITEVALDPGGGSAALDFRYIQKNWPWDSSRFTYRGNPFTDYLIN